jgi:hypothetical protein
MCRSVSVIALTGSVGGPQAPTHPHGMADAGGESAPAPKKGGLLGAHAHAPSSCHLALAPHTALPRGTDIPLALPADEIDGLLAAASVAKSSVNASQDKTKEMNQKMRRQRRNSRDLGVPPIRRPHGCRIST